MNKGLLIIVSAPSGCGKGTILAEILKDKNFHYSVSATTRQPRPEDTDGVTYYFYTKEQFEEMIKNGGMLEYASYCGNYYGTPFQTVEDKRCEGKDVILEIEVQGALKVMERYPDALSVFILPPSLKELRRRLDKRGTEPPEVIDKRVAQADREIRFAKNYRYIMMNAELDDAVNDLKAIIRAEKLKNTNSINMIDEVLENA